MYVGQYRTHHEAEMCASRVTKCPLSSQKSRSGRRVWMVENGTASNSQLLSRLRLGEGLRWCSYRTCDARPTRGHRGAIPGNFCEGGRPS